MGRIVANFFTSLDGVVESPNLFVGPYFDDQVGAAVGAGTEGAEAFLMGHRLYDEWSAYWPTSTDEPFASMINGTDKYVVAGSPFEPTWSGATVLAGDDLADQVRDLKGRLDTTVSFGSPTTVRWLLAEGLLDELHLLVFPVVVGTGERLFGEGQVPMRLISSEALPTGVLHLVYAPEPVDPGSAS